MAMNGKPIGKPVAGWMQQVEYDRSGTMMKWSMVHNEFTPDPNLQDKMYNLKMYLGERVGLLITGIMMGLLLAEILPF